VASFTVQGIESSMNTGRSSLKLRFGLIGSILYPGFHSRFRPFRVCGPTKLCDDTHSVARALAGLIGTGTSTFLVSPDERGNKPRL